MRRAGAAGWFVHDVKNRGITAWLITIFLLGFYILLYFGGKIFKPENDPFILTAKAMGLPSKWTLYGLIYTIAILVCGIYVIIKYKHNRYQIVRTCVVIFSQVVLAFSIPLMLKFFEQPEYYFSYIWPLKIEYFYPSTIVSQPLPFVLYSIFAGVVLAPFMALIFGKRWYCSWVCGCGGLANTFGEPWRHLSDKSSTSWKIEKFTIHAVLVLSVLVTIVAFASVALPKSSGMVPVSKEIRSWYGLIIGSVLSGVVTVPTIFASAPLFVLVALAPAQVVLLVAGGARSLSLRHPPGAGVPGGTGGAGAGNGYSRGTRGPRGLLGWDAEPEEKSGLPQ